MVAVLLSLIAGCTPTPPPTPPQNNAAPTETTMDFRRDIQPIFAEHCFECHGSDKEEGGLRLDDLARCLAGGKSGSAVIVPGNRAESLLYQYITGQNEDHVIMPPKEHGNPASAGDCEMVGMWIDQLPPREAAPNP